MMGWMDRMDRMLRLDRRVICLGLCLTGASSCEDPPASRNAKSPSPVTPADTAAAMPGATAGAVSPAIVPTGAEAHDPAPDSPDTGPSADEGGSTDGDSTEGGSTDSTETGATEPAPANPDLRLVDLGATVVDALKKGDTDAIVNLTPLGQGEAASQCPDAPAGVESKLEIEARARHCARSIPWDAVTDVRVAGAAPTGPAEGCRDGTVSFDRLRMLVVAPGAQWEIDLLGAVGSDAKPNAFSGAITCKKR